MEHRFGAEHCADANAVQPPGQAPIRTPDFDAVRPPEAVQLDVAGEQARSYPCPLRRPSAHSRITRSKAASTVARKPPARIVRARRREIFKPSTGMIARGL